MSLKEELVVLVLLVARKKMSKTVIPEFDACHQLGKKFHLNREKGATSHNNVLKRIFIGFINRVFDIDGLVFKII